MTVNSREGDGRRGDHDNLILPPKNILNPTQSRFLGKPEADARISCLVIINLVSAMPWETFGLSPNGGGKT